MKRFFVITAYCINLLVGYLTVPLTMGGFIIATNSSKGWNVQDEDGKIFIPLGILILLLLLLILALNIIKILCYKKIKEKKNFLNNAIKSSAYFAGILIYLLHYGCKMLL